MLIQVNKIERNESSKRETAIGFYKHALMIMQKHEKINVYVFAKIVLNVRRYWKLQVSVVLRKSRHLVKRAVELLVKMIAVLLY